jgi:GT2 family glycosyltransferase
MDVSIIIVNWNTKDLLVPCLRSIYRKSGNVKAEVFVVDNGSMDGSKEAVEAEFPEVILIDNPMNFGFAKASNQGIDLSKGKYVLLLNPDTELKEGAIATLNTFLDHHPEAGVAGAQLLNADGAKQNAIANFPSLATELLNKSLLRRLFPDRFPGKEREYALPIEVDSVIGACMMVRREAMEEVGLLDEDYFLFLEETDWCYRMKKAGWKVYHVPGAEVIHYQGKGAERDKKRAKVEYYRSRYLFFKKNRGFWERFFLRIGLMIKLCFEFFAMAFVCILTGFAVKNWRRKLTLYAYLLWWHLKKGTGYFL